MNLGIDYDRFRWQQLDNNCWLCFAWALDFQILNCYWNYNKPSRKERLDWGKNVKGVTYGLSGIKKLILDTGNANNSYARPRSGRFGYHRVTFHYITWLLTIGFLRFWNSKRMENSNPGLETRTRGPPDRLENVQVLVPAAFTRGIWKQLSPERLARPTFCKHVEPEFAYYFFN